MRPGDDAIPQPSAYALLLKDCKVRATTEIAPCAGSLRGSPFHVWFDQGLPFSLGMASGGFNKAPCWRRLLLILHKLAEFVIIVHVDQNK
jgi:hypothetical protein